MTVTYSAKVATASFGRFFKLLKRWRGSIYKLLFKEFALYATAYFIIAFVYRFALNDAQKRVFETVAEYCAKFTDMIPVVFVLGFYVNHVASLWWDKFRTLPWPGRIAMLVSAHLHGHNDGARLMRRTIMRYVCLSYVITMSSICPPVNKRFPTLQHMADAGLILPNEAMILTNLKTNYNKFFVPLIWCTALVSRARKEGRIKDDFAVNNIIDELNDFRTKSFQLFNYNWVSLPLVYTQVVTIAVHTFFVTCLLARQRLDNGVIGDFYFPIFTFLQFVFYMGWLKVAETMLNPFGEDDDDFDINYLIDRHLKISYLVVDEMHAEHPELIKDQYWDTADFDLPYTEETQRYHNTEEKQAAAADIDIPLFLPGTITATNSLQCISEEMGGDLLTDLPPHSLQSRDHRYMQSRSSAHHRHHHQTPKSPGIWKSIKRSVSRQSSTASIRRASLPTERKPARRMTSRDSTASQTRYTGAVDGRPEVQISMERLQHSPVHVQGDQHLEDLMFHMSDIESEDGHDALLGRNNRDTSVHPTGVNNNNKFTSRSVSRGSEAESLFNWGVSDTRPQRGKQGRADREGSQVVTEDDAVETLSLIAEDSPETPEQFDSHRLLQCSTSVPATRYAPVTSAPTGATGATERVARYTTTSAAAAAGSVASAAGVARFTTVAVPAAAASPTRSAATATDPAAELAGPATGLADPAAGLAGPVTGLAGPAATIAPATTARASMSGVSPSGDSVRSSCQLDSDLEDKIRENLKIMRQASLSSQHSITKTCPDIS